MGAEDDGRRLFPVGADSITSALGFMCLVILRDPLRACFNEHSLFSHLASFVAWCGHSDNPSPGYFVDLIKASWVSC